MALTKEERNSFLGRMGAVQDARLSSSDAQETVPLIPEERWSDAAIEMAIDMGF